MQLATSTMSLGIPQRSMSSSNYQKAQRLSDNVNDGRVVLSYDEHNRADKRSPLPFILNYPFTSIRSELGSYLLIEHLSLNTKLGLRMSDNTPVIIWNTDTRHGNQSRNTQRLALEKIHTIHQRIGLFSDLILSRNCQKK